MKQILRKTDFYEFFFYLADAKHCLGKFEIKLSRFSILTGIILAQNFTGENIACIFDIASVFKPKWVK